MAKLSLTDISAGYLAATTFNANNALIEAALENTLSRDGTTPNTMSANLDMNSNRIVNVTDPVNAQDVATKNYVTAYGVTGGNSTVISLTTNTIDLVNDVSPQLGGTLDANTFSIDMGTNLVTDSKVGQWDTAYNWGDHSTAGYITDYTVTEADVETALASATAFAVNNFTFNVDQTVGAGQDNYVLTYDNGTGEISLETTQLTTLADLSVTATAAELNILDGVTATATELNAIDLSAQSVTSGKVYIGSGAATAGWRVLVEADISDLQSYLVNIVEDTTPQLGGTLDAQDNKIEQYALGYSATWTEPVANTVRFDVSSGGLFFVDLDDPDLAGNVTIDFINYHSTGKVHEFQVKIQQRSASPYTVTWPAEVVWPGGTAPTMSIGADAVDIYSFMTHDGGTTVYGFSAQDFS